MHPFEAKELWEKQDACMADCIDELALPPACFKTHAPAPSDQEVKDLLLQHHWATRRLIAKLDDVRRPGHRRTAARRRGRAGLLPNRT